MRSFNMRLGLLLLFRRRPGLVVVVVVVFFFAKVAALSVGASLETFSLRGATKAFFAGGGAPEGLSFRGAKAFFFVFFSGDSSRSRFFLRSSASSASFASCAKRDTTAGLATFFGGGRVDAFKGWNFFIGGR